MYFRLYETNGGDSPGLVTDGRLRLEIGQPAEHGSRVIRDLGRSATCLPQPMSIWNVWNDLRFGARMLRKSPGFAIAAALTLAFGIGATTATFSVADAMLWKPIPLPELDRLMVIFQSIPGEPGNYQTASYADIDDFRRRAESLEDIAVWSGGLANIVGAGGEPERVTQYLVSANFFDVLGVHPAFGR